MSMKGTDRRSRHKVGIVAVFSVTMSLGKFTVQDVFLTKSNYEQVQHVGQKSNSIGPNRLKMAMHEW